MVLRYGAKIRRLVSAYLLTHCSHVTPLTGHASHWPSLTRHASLAARCVPAPCSPCRYGGASAATVPLFVDDFKAMATGSRMNHPCIVQITTFNEGDCWSVFKVRGKHAQQRTAVG